MALRRTPITAQLGSQLGWLSIGISNTSIRLNHTRSKKPKQRIEPSFAPGHGELIYVHHHVLDGMTVYSHDQQMKANKALRQIPFNGKKLKPAKLRKDLWRPLATIQFPEGFGEVGRSVYQRLRECKTLHELAWDDSYFHDSETGRPLTRHDRGRKLNDQKANTIADMAAVLAGLGKGNKMWATMSDFTNAKPDAAPDAVEDKAASAEQKQTPANDETAAKATKEDLEIETEVDGMLSKADEQSKGLIRVQVWWQNPEDKNYAQDWTTNVSHCLFEEVGTEAPTIEEATAAALEGVQEGLEGGERVPPELVADKELPKNAGGDRRV
ncbi:hypothetical protein F5Y15DRAFT_325517 [Xylariaceae sp. FL0016]|nr:hypothetical protein F5Y15DRAFT_325517 [Xylariaceae sp. FL0016]